jgi:hypothetical protein
MFVKISSRLPKVFCFMVGIFAGTFGLFQSSAEALNFSFAFPNTSPSGESGPLLGTIELPGTSGSNISPTSITIDSAPGSLSQFNGLELIGNSGFKVEIAKFNFTASGVLDSDVLISSNNTLSSIGNNYLAFRLRAQDSNFPLNYFGASTSNTVFPPLATGSSLTSPFASGDRSLVTYTPTSAAVPFEFSPTLGLLVVGGVSSLSYFRRKIAMCSNKL